MPKLLEYMKLRAEELADAKNIKAGIKSVGQYIGVDDIEIIETLKPGWAEGYANFLKQDYKNIANADKPLSAQTRLNHLSALRNVLRHAMLDGLYPAIDVMEPYARTGKSEAPKNGISMQRKEMPNQADDIKKLCRASLSNEDELVRNLYLVGLLCGGLEIEGILELQVSKTDGVMSVETPEGRLLRNSDEIAYLLSPHFTSEVSEEKVSLQNLISLNVEQFAASLTDLSQRRRLALYRGGSIFTDYICIATAQGNKTREAICEYVADTDAGRHVPYSDRFFVSKDFGMIIPRWYALRSVSMYNTGRSLFDKVKMLPEYDTIVQDYYLPGDSASAQSSSLRSLDKVSAVDKYVFIKGTTTTMNVIVKKVKFLLPYKSHTDGGYVTVPYSQLNVMRQILAYMNNEDLEVYDNEDFRKRYGIPEIKEGDKVRVKLPGYDRFLATVIRRDGHHKYHVSFDNLGLHFLLTNLPPSLLIPT